MVFGKSLQQCSLSPLTGYYRSGMKLLKKGSCEWHDSNDYGIHTVCAQMTCQFLEFTRSHGNDLSTPSNSSQFSGLREGNRWYLCAGRWKEALAANVTPPVILRATHHITLQYVKLDELRKYAFCNNNRRQIKNKT
ncbi:unnamed protein product [Rotaria sp. Silwood1]|nr:unnamed protein product [Rotaria sp. Silwood1]CAF0836075.1 unnamed protein product [Rotaria sp. Silwood1]CAF3399665.1 unnamed protein product [Rotaria sp. Silwood1]CAF3403449.1 unnamed protein product [Rotaria sp. Silwood1]CAF4914954.1 unnamed protein product [Rotaria sp. Silwood1]